MSLAVRRPRLSILGRFSGGSPRRARRRSRTARRSPRRSASTRIPLTYPIGREAAQALGAPVRRRRTYTIPLPDELGAEISIPALPRLGIGRRTLTLLLLLAWLLTARRAWISEEFRINDVTVEGAGLLSEAQIESIARLNGSHIFALDPQAATQRLVSYPEIDAAEVRLQWPGNKVTITVEERRPIVEWHDGGKTWWLSASGVAFIQRQPYKAMVEVTSLEPVLEISQDALVPAIDPELLWSAVTLSEQLPYATDLTYSADHGFGFDDPRGWNVLFGQGGDMDTKVAVYEAIALSLVEQGLNAVEVSVEDPASPYYKLTR
ncbi:MAG: cell division protein FtsQ/DivIB [Anaerolineales bacterium]